MWLWMLFFFPVLWSQAFTIMDQNRDGFIDKNDLRDTFAALGMWTPFKETLKVFIFAHAVRLHWLFGAAGRLNVKQEEIDDMLKEAPGPINFTIFLTMFGEKLKGKNWPASKNYI